MSCAAFLERAVRFPPSRGMIMLVTAGGDFAKDQLDVPVRLRV